MLDDLSAGLLAADHSHLAAVGILLLLAVRVSGRSSDSSGRKPHGEDVPQGAAVSAAATRESVIE